ncbi:secreted RxLR effector protein 161-like [Humulus lupulus]|uniref:secreted RxLR effector protein 161-like n=1 Tax=Humulus lupulus TaxID=3486 RepID=UPI002B409300|nr:secreted RxLR effector protein 161-like [Humulus lupulus]
MSGGEKLSAFGSDPVPDTHFYRSLSPLESHWKVMKKILRYLKGTLDFGLSLKKCSNLSLTGFCDAYWASDPDDSRSTSGFYVYLGANLVSWASKKQRIVSCSSTEVGYHSLANATVEVVWI